MGFLEESKQLLGGDNCWTDTGRGSWKDTGREKTVVGHVQGEGGQLLDSYWEREDMCSTCTGRPRAIVGHVQGG